MSTPGMSSVPKALLDTIEHRVKPWAKHTYPIVMMRGALVQCRAVVNGNSVTESTLTNLRRFVRRSQTEVGH